MTDIVKRLRAPAYWMSGSDEGHEGDNDAPREAADLIEALRAENTRLREALEEVLWYTNQLEMQAYDPNEWPKVHDAVAKARAALAQKEESNG